MDYSTFTGYIAALDSVLYFSNNEIDCLRVRLWKIELRKLADEMGLAMSVCHLLPGASKWNKIEHRLFLFIRQNWRDKPLISHAVIVNWIAATTPKTGLNVECVLDTQAYPTGIVVSDEELA